MLGLRDKVALVTGGSSGIGEACARRLCDEGAIVVVAGRDAARTRAVAASLSDDDRASYVLGDVTRVADCERIVAETLERHGRLDILVNSAGVWLERPILETSEDDWDACIDTNLKGAFFTMKAALRAHGRAQEGRHRQHRQRLGSPRRAGSGCLFGRQGRPHHAHPLPRHRPRPRRHPPRLRLARRRRHADAREGRSPTRADPAAYAAVQADRYPLGRIGRPEEIAAVVAFLASDEAGLDHGRLLVGRRRRHGLTSPGSEARWPTRRAATQAPDAQLAASSSSPT